MSGSRRNIVLVTMDSLRADHCSFMGYGRETTPALDRLAADGLVFDNAVAAGVPTIASMTSVMTGEYSYASPEIGFDEQQREQVTSRRTVAEVLSDAGYSTGALSPNPPASSYFGFDDGFDWFEDFLGADRGLLDRGWNRVMQRSIQGGRGATYLRLARNVLRREEVLRPWEDYYDQLLAWRERVQEPYFLWILLLEPHHPWLPPSDQQRWSSRLDAYRSFRYYWRMLSEGWEPEFAPAERQRLIDLYDDSIRHGDRFLERLWADLADDDPVFVVHADHGEEFGEHGRYGHQPHLCESLVHVPLVIANVGERQRVERPVSLRSLAPTLAELADEHAAFGTPGLRSDPGSPWVTSKVFPGGTRRMALRTRDHKYIEDGERRELYDLRLDPDEQVDLVDDRPSLASTFAAMSRQEVASEREQRAVSRSVPEVTGQL